MPSRIIREGILESDRVQRLLELGGWEAEVFYRRLHQIVDDFGCYPADPRVLRPRLYPLALDQMREANVSRCLKFCQTAGLVRLYSVGAKQYLQVKDFGQRTRLKLRKCPAPPDEVDDGQMTGACQSDDGHVRAEADSDSDSDTESERGGEPPGFVSFWRAWPRSIRKKGRGKALAKWKRDRLELIAESVLRAVEVFKASADWTKDGGQYVPGPLPWLNDAPWETDPEDLVNDTYPVADGNGFIPARPTADEVDQLLGWGEYAKTMTTEAP